MQKFLFQLLIWSHLLLAWKTIKFTHIWKKMKELSTDIFDKFWQRDGANINPGDY